LGGNIKVHKRITMKQATIIFENETELRMALDSNKFYNALHQIDAEARNYLKHGCHKFKTPEEVLEWVRERITDEEIDLHGYY